LLKFLEMKNKKWWDYLSGYIIKSRLCCFYPYQIKKVLLYRWVGGQNWNMFVQFSCISFQVKLDFTHQCSAYFMLFHYLHYIIHGIILFFFFFQFNSENLYNPKKYVFLYMSNIKLRICDKVLTIIWAP